MEFVAIIFVIVMGAAALAATALIGWVAGIWAALGFALVLFLLYRAATRDIVRPFRRRDTLNAFQKHLSDD
ncbi:hypothetical protein [Pararhodobacter sp. CCB-MM2]|uniref:hypothetical protein n=1 Tax=Pararhodobacter sp. CCB-MM2 TaxID=1786003 RepID=UPI000835B8BA|nr:hypothetical protein [Pararhodobacter sp. CCB-MM2]